MPVFDSAEQMYEIFTPYLLQITKDPIVGPKFAKANTSFRVTYTAPDCVFFLDATQDPPTVKAGDDALRADAEVGLTMTADDGHEFWLGKLKIPLALARRKIKIDGPVTKMLGMIPAIQPAFAMYRTYLAESGHGDLI